MTETITAARVGFGVAAGVAVTITAVVGQSLTTLPAGEITSVGPPGLVLSVGGVTTMVGLLAMGAALSQITRGESR